MIDLKASPVSPAARLSFLLGLAALFFGALAGLPALYVGLLAIRGINTRDGARRGLRLAVAGMVLGALGSMITLAGVGVIVIAHLTVRAQRVECIDHLRQLGIAVSRYADNHSEAFPPATFPNANLRPEERLSWVAGLLPYLGEREANKRHQELAGKLDTRLGWNNPRNAEVLNTTLPVCLCPAHPHFERRSRPGLTHYVGLSGLGPGAADLPTDSPRAGIFGNNRRVTRADLLAGLSCTMLLVETGQDNGPWLAGGPATVRELAPDEKDYLGRGRPFGGLHAGGANVLWADISVRWMNDRVPPADFRAFATLAGHPGGPAGE